MKAPTVFVSLLALAGVAATADSADAAIADLEIPDDLREAICYQDWYEAIELSSRLITSSKITPEHRQTLLDWRRNFYTYAKGDQANPHEIADCKGMQPTSLHQQVPRYQGPAPRFSSNSVSYTSGRYCYQRKVHGDVEPVDSQCSKGTTAPVETTVEALPQQATAPDSVWAVGTRVEGNSVKGTLLNNGLAAVRNVTLTVRSRQGQQSDTVKTVAIDTVNAWSEAEFVATFNHAPGNWLIESIEVN